MTQWQPAASIKNLQSRAKILHKIRCFFAERGILEVETPILSHASVTEPTLHSFKTTFQLGSLDNTKTMYLQTSPEYAMKRLLAFGSGPIYQMTKSFRNEECGRFHNPEFTMLEWYRPGFDHHALMNDMDDLLQCVLQSEKALRLSYQAVFQHYLKICPHAASIEELMHCASMRNIDIAVNAKDKNDKDFWLFLLMTHVIEPQLGLDKPVFIYDYPASQASLSQIKKGNIPVAERFEVYIQGIELANGFHELTAANEQEQRFQLDLAKREALKLENIPIDHYLIDALRHGMPACSGVALGIDRLVMLALNCDHIQDVLAFTVENA